MNSQSTPMRVLVAARLSVLHDGETGLDSQEQEAVRWAEAHGHEVVGVAADHKSGKTHLWDRPELRPWVTKPEMLSRYDALVALKVDRLTRADDEGVDALKAWARKNHKQLLITSADVRFPSEGMEGVRWDMYIRMAHQEWLDIKERYGRMQRSKHEAGSIVGRGPFGYEITVTPEGLKTLTPTAEGRLWVPRIFTWAAEGKSTYWIAAELEKAGVPSTAKDGRWRESSVSSIVRRTTYSGTRVRKGRSSLSVEALVPEALRAQAASQIASRARMGRTTTKHPKALLAALRCGHPDCPGEGSWPMYRWLRSGKPTVYRCAGRGPQRRGCGAPHIKMEVLDALVLSASEYWDATEYRPLVFVQGNDQGRRLETLRAEMTEVLAKTPTANLPKVVAGYAARIAALEAEGSVTDHWAEQPSGITEGMHLQSLDLDGQREYLGRKDMRAWKIGDQVNVTIDGALARKGGRTAIGDLAQSQNEE